MKKWFWTLICAVLVSSMLLAACGTAATPADNQAPAANTNAPAAPASGQPVTIRFFHKWPEQVGS